MNFLEIKMVLPLLGSFLGSALLPGMFGGSLGTVAAGAIGSGLGSLLQGDDFEDAVTTGLTSFMGGKLLGGLGKTPELAKGEGIAGMLNPKLAEGASTGFNALQGKDALTGALKGGLETIKANPMTAAGIGGGALLGNQMTQVPEMEEKKPYVPTETMPFQQNINQPPPGYRPGIDPQFNYGFYNPSASELKTRVLQEGGMAGAAPPNEKDIIINAVNAVKGNMDEQSASIALAQFSQQYGQEALRELIADVQAGEYDSIGGKADGMIDGGGDGMSDSVPATIDGNQDLLISKDEYVVDAPTVAMIGNGSSDAGAKKLDKMREDVRKAATGSSMQPKKIDSMEILNKALS